MKPYILLGIFSALLAITPAYASGGGGGGGGFGGGGFGGGGVYDTTPRTRTINQETYRLGQQIFSGRAELTSEVSSKALKKQTKAIQKMQTQIAAKSSAADAKKLNVTKLAGRMSSKQLRALKYYVRVRYTHADDYATR